MYPMIRKSIFEKQHLLANLGVNELISVKEYRSNFFFVIWFKSLLTTAAFVTTVRF